MNRQIVTTLNSISYSLEPGDGTRYDFIVMQEILRFKFIDGIAQGAKRGHDAFITIAITGSPSGVCKTLISECQNLSWSHILYTSCKMPRVDLYTIAAILLAAGILIDDPLNIEKACAAMRKAKEYVE